MACCGTITSYGETIHFQICSVAKEKSVFAMRGSCWSKWFLKIDQLLDGLGKGSESAGVTHEGSILIFHFRPVYKDRGHHIEAFGFLFIAIFDISKEKQIENNRNHGEGFYVLVGAVRFHRVGLVHDFEYRPH